MRDIENHMVVDEIWITEENPCSKCGYSKKLCECEDERD